MSADLEARVEALRAQLDEIAKRVRLDAVAQRFLAGEHEVRPGDYFELDDGSGLATKLRSVSSDGRWTYYDGRGHIESYRVPRQGDYERLYTVSEVAEVVAKAVANDRAAR